MDVEVKKIKHTQVAFMSEYNLMQILIKSGSGSFNWFHRGFFFQLLPSKKQGLKKHSNTYQYLACMNLKGYSGVSLIHGLNHSETVLDAPVRDQVGRRLI